ncbi:acrosomal protein SP-10-like isoform X4 [Cervus elaphus]|uniref:acrosomal protein SP-10-like isoform X4 n=1 Tax=Cervus elaphus TaxID=9860 RepID=UPI001CC28CC7|nr:acrosomal protein SP-10-like isoform X4 [Cervus elaphus]
MKNFLLLVSLCFLGSARGASTQSDELLGSMDHQPSVQQLSREAAAGEHTLNEHASGEQPSVEQPIGEQPLGEQSVGEQAIGEQPTSEQVASDKPAGEHDQSSGEQPSDLPPSSTFSGPSLSCHTCSYMNDQGKCLRGEGVCATQNSQQCMLKKIFEGGKLQFMVQGCENMCPSMNLFSHGTRMQIICCRNQSFCNKI